MARIHQVIATLTPGVGETNDALALQAQFGGPSLSLLAVADLPSDPGLRSVCTTLEHLERNASPDDPVLLHTGLPIGVPALSPAMLARLKGSRELIGRVHRSAGWVELPEWVQRGIATSMQVAASHPTSVVVAVAGPLLPLDGYESLSGEGQHTPMVLCHEPIAADDGVADALITTHLLRSHRLAGVAFTHIGAAYDQNRLDALVRIGGLLRLHRSWLGAPAHDAVLGAYGGASAVLCLTEGDGFPDAAVQAMTAGIPVVGYATPVNVEVIGEAGILIERQDRFVLVEAIAALIEDAALAHCFSTKGRERAKLFQPQVAASLVHRFIGAR